jgi:hypothetical protein
MSNLIFHVRKKYFDQIKNGHKTEEFRIRSPYWIRRIQGIPHKTVFIYNGYTKEYLKFPYIGHAIVTITHEEFGPDPVEVFKIPLRWT